MPDMVIWLSLGSVLDGALLNELYLKIQYGLKDSKYTPAIPAVLLRPKIAW
jgi:hypothetical protein